MGRVRWVWIVTMVVLADGCVRAGYDEPRVGDGPGPTVDAPLQPDAQQVDGPQRVDAFPQDSPTPDAPDMGWAIVNHNLTTSTLNGVWTDSPSRVYVVGNAGIVLYFDGAAWSKLSNTQLTADLHAVWGAKMSSSGPVSLYMVGATPYVWRLEGQNWVDSLQAPTSSTLFDVWAGPSIADLWVVGANATVLQGLLPNALVQRTHTCTADHLRTVIGGDSKMMAGEGGKICYHKGSIQEVVHNLTTEALNASWVDPASGQIWFAGNNGTVLRVDGGIPSLITTQVNGNLRGIWGSSGSDIWAVGGNGIILHYDGKTWSQVTSPTSVVLHDVWGSSTSDVWAVGMGGTVIRYLGGTL